MAESISQDVETPETRMLRELAELLRFQIEESNRPCCLKLLTTEQEAHARTRKQLEAEKRAHTTTKTEKDGEIQRHNATIKTITEELEAEKRAHTMTKTEKNGEIQRHNATIKTIAEQLEAEKRAHTTTRTEKDGEIRRHNATIKTITDQLEAEKRAHTTTRTEKDGEIRRHNATIKTITEQLEAEKRAHMTTKTKLDPEKLAHGDTGRDVRGMSGVLNETDDDEFKDLEAEMKGVEGGAGKVVEGSEDEEIGKGYQTGGVSETNQTDPSRVKSKYKIVNVTKISHTFRADEFIFRDSNGNSKSTGRGDWKPIKYGGQTAWMNSRYVCLESDKFK